MGPNTAVKAKGEEEFISKMSNTRFGRGWVLAATSRIRRIEPRTTAAQLWKVESESTPNTFYDVLQKSDGETTCTCPDFEIRGQICKHIYAVVISESQIQKFVSDNPVIRTANEKEHIGAKKSK
jgi:uncharacterized Zn finger protein